MNKMETVNAWEKKLSAYQYAFTLMGLDNNQNPPSEGREYRNERRAILMREFYEVLNDPKIYELLKELKDDPELDELEQRYDEGCQIVGGRSGLVEKSDIHAMRNFLQHAQHCLSNYAAVNETDERIDSLIAQLEMDSFFRIKKDSMGEMVERLSYGLHHYFRRNYMHIDEIVFGSNEPENDAPES